MFHDIALFIEVGKVSQTLFMLLRFQSAYRSLLYRLKRLHLLQYV